MVLVPDRLLGKQYCIYISTEVGERDGKHATRVEITLNMEKGQDWSTNVSQGKTSNGSDMIF